MEQEVSSVPAQATEAHPEQGQSAQAGNVLVKKLGLVLSVFVFLLPVFFVPAAGVGLYVAKIALLATGLVAIFAIFLSSVLGTGVVEIPKVRYLLPMLAFAVIALISSAFSGTISSSVLGTVFDMGTSGSIILLVFTLFMTIVAVKSVKVVGKVISAFIFSAMALAVYTLFGSLLGAHLPDGLASRLPLFLSGGVIDTAIIFGAAVILSLCAINMADISKKMRIGVYLLIAFSMLFVGASNFLPVTLVLGLVSLVFFVYILSWSVGKKNEPAPESQPDESSAPEASARKFSLSSLVVLIVSVVLVLGGSSLGGFLSSALKLQVTEIRPNFETTMDMTISSWKSNFALGVGPNRFASFWNVHKPVEINQTQFWNTDFYSGSGFIPTVAVTTGLLGLLALLAFIGMYVLSGVKAIFAQANSGKSRYLATSSFLVSLYLWIMLFFYTPSITVMALAFIFTGLFTATLVPQGIIGLFKVNIFSNPKTNFLAVLSIVVLLIVSVAGGYFVWERAAAAVVFERGIIEYQKTGDLAVAREAIAKSINMVPSDAYWRGLTEISLADLGRVMSGITDQNQINDAVRVEVQNIIASSIESAKQAVAVDEGNFRNWFALARVYEVLASNGIEGSAENARANYTEAAKRAPTNPAVPLAVARLDALDAKIDEARANIVKALELKNNYTDAYYTLAQLEVGANNIPDAIRSVEAALVTDPYNSGLYFQSGLLKYNQKDYAGAAASFEKAVSLVPDYANAKYFLGLSYYEIGKKEEAVKQFEEVNQTNPENQEVVTILSNLKDGKAPFVNVSKPDDSKPPVEEE